MKLTDILLGIILAGIAALLVNAWLQIHPLSGSVKYDVNNQAIEAFYNGGWQKLTTNG